MSAPETSETQPPATAPEPTPVRINHIQLAALTAVLAGVLAAGSALGPVATGIAVGVLQLVLIPCWVLGNRLPGRIGGLILGLLAAAGADLLTLHWPDDGYSPALGVLGVAIPVMFFHQLTRGVVRSRVVESLAGITLLVAGVVAPSGLIVLRHQASGRTIALAVLAAAGIGLVAAHLADAVLPAPRFDPALDRGLPAVLTGLVVGGVTGYLGLRRLIDFAGGRGAFVGAALATVACLLSIAASFAEAHSVSRPAVEASGPADQRPARDRLTPLRPAASAALTLALTVPAAYLLTNALTS